MLWQKYNLHVFYAVPIIVEISLQRTKPSWQNSKNATLAGIKMYIKFQIVPCISPSKAVTLHCIYLNTLSLKHTKRSEH